MLRFVPHAAAAALALAAGTAAQDRLIAVDSARAVYEINMATGEKTQIGTVSSNAGTTAGLAYDRATGTMYLTSTGNDSLYTLDLTTFEATLVGPYDPLTPAIVMHGLEFDDSTGTLYAASSHNGGLYTINTTTGAATLVGSSGLTSFTNLGYDPTTNVMYGTNSGTDSFYLVDRATGAMTLIGPLTGPTNPNGLAYNTTDNKLYLVDNSTDILYTINLTTGGANAIGPTGTGNLLGLAFIPETSTPACYANCDGSTTEPILNVADFTCFLSKFAGQDPYANCDGSTTEPILNVADFTCFLSKFAAGC
jgi:DNA-binding beta-propeller fold protein YncE